jgi:hypothetical protein
MVYIPSILLDPDGICHPSCFSELYSYSEESLHSPPPFELPPPPSICNTKQPLAGIFPMLPNAHNFSALGRPSEFKSYITETLPFALRGLKEPQLSTPSSLPPPSPYIEKYNCPINSAFIRNRLQDATRMLFIEMDWVSKRVFPDSKLPKPFLDEGLKRYSPLWRPVTVNKTTLNLPTDRSKEGVTRWLLNIKNALALAHGLTTSDLLAGVASNRTFDPSASTEPLVADNVRQKPDISVISVRNLQNNAWRGLRPDWRQVDALIEVISTASHEEIVRQLTAKAAVMFIAQPHRQFVCAMALFNDKDTGNFSYLFAVIDRAGIIDTNSIPLFSYSSIDFLRIVYGLCFAAPATLGADPTMGLDPITNEVITITVQGKDPSTSETVVRPYSVVKLLHSSPTLFGRGTRVWICRDEFGRFFILKDSWLLTEKTSDSEINFINSIEDIVKTTEYGYLFQHCNPKLELGQEVVSTTKVIRGPFSTSSSRTQRRIVTGPIGDPLTSFRSKHELIGVAIDVVNCKLIYIEMSARSQCLY